MTGRSNAALEQGPEGFRERVALCTSRFDLERLIAHVARSHDYSHYVLMQVPSSKDDTLAALIVMTNWPDALISSFDEQQYLARNPIIETPKSTNRPLVWSYRTSGPHQMRDPIAERAELFRSHGMTSGVQISLQEPSGNRAYLGFGGNRAVPGEAELADLSFFGNLAYDRFWELRRATRPDTVQKLSSRETECLTWTASGKTSAEIAIILRLSEHTVNHYLAAACQKLGATNRVHAVYKAMRAGILT